MSDIKDKPQEYWKGKLDEEQFRVLRCSATEAPFSGKYWNNHETGMYQCAACGQELFSSDTKFESGTGWPSFDNPVNKAHIEVKEDTSYNMSRTEVVCSNCGSHLGHLFTDGPAHTTGLRYCINSAALDFKKEDA